jgi:hypothetical protein
MSEAVNNDRPGLLHAGSLKRREKIPALIEQRQVAQSYTA